MTLTSRQKTVLEALQDAQQNHKTLPSFTDQYPDFEVGDAYGIQQALIKSAREGGDVRIGFKMGLTSRAKQESMGLDSSVYGQLLRSMVLSEGDDLDASTPVQPRAEPEVGVQLKASLEGPGITGMDVMQATAVLFPVVEVLNSRFEDYNFTLPDVIADNTSAYRIVVGSYVRDPGTVDLRSMGVLVEKNGRVEHTGAGGAILGNPLNAVADLANLRARQGREPLRAGQIVLTGGITDAVPVDPGDHLHVEFQNLGGVSVVCS